MSELKNKKYECITEASHMAKDRYDECSNFYVTEVSFNETNDLWEISIQIDGEHGAHYKCWLHEEEIICDFVTEF